MVGRTAAVVLASGYGTLRESRCAYSYPKVLEEIGGMSLLARLVSSVRDAGFSPCIVVVNPVSGLQIRRSLDAGNFETKEFKIRYALQKRRGGAAEAALIGAMAINRRKTEDFLLAYADMPFWSATTMRALSDEHHRHRADISLVTIPLRVDRAISNTLMTYGHVIRNEEGKIERIVEAKDATPDDLVRASALNPSLYVIRRNWLKARVKGISLSYKQGETPATVTGERHVPPLLARAYRDGSIVGEVHLADLREAIGINTQEQFVEAQQTFRGWHHTLA